MIMQSRLRQPHLPRGHPTGRVAGPPCDAQRVDGRLQRCCVGGLLIAALLASCSTAGGDAGSPGPRSAAGSVGAAHTPSGQGPGTPGPAPSEGSPTTQAAPSLTVTAPPGRSPSPDVLAGVLEREVPQVGDGATHVVPGASSAPGDGTVRRIRVSVEGGLPVDGHAFASFVLRTLNDPRGWTRDGYTFARTDGEAETEVVLASPQTSAKMCRPLVTNGTLSCRKGDRVVLTWYRWVHGQEDFGGDLTLYRQYLVNHEVGHFLGHGHVGCPGPGKLAPVMMQQTKGVGQCKPNGWPYP